MKISEIVGRPAALEQLAEEAAELSQAALKLARKLRGENPTPRNREELERAVIEEYSDVRCVANELGLIPSYTLMETKRSRWLQRLKEEGIQPDQEGRR